MMIESGNEVGKKLIDLALTCGRKWQSSQTQYIHYHYHTTPLEKHETIPSLENFLFALTLLRSRNVDNALEAKLLIDRLLFFQNNYGGDSLGNFPMYLHEYPLCKDKYVGVYILAPLYWILKDFHHVLGVELNEKLKKVSHLLLSYCSKLITGSTPHPIAVRIAAALKAYGDFFAIENWREAGEKSLELMASDDHHVSWGVPSQLASLLVGLQMVYPSLAQSPWVMFLDYLSKTWHERLGVYIGPGIHENQVQYQPEASLYDLFMGSFTGHLSSRALVMHPYQLHAVLVQPFKDLFSQFPSKASFDGLIEGFSWTTSRSSEFAVTCVNKQILLDPSYEKAFIPLKICWGGLERLHTYVCQGGHIDQIDYLISDNAIDLFLTLAPRPQLEDKEKQQEICFYFDLIEGTKVLVNGILANTFMLGEELKIIFPSCEVTMVMHLLEGEGQFIGHSMRGNRPSQISAKGEHRFFAYDGQVFLRTLRRSELCRIRVCLKLDVFS